MRLFISPTQHKRFNEAVGLVLLSLGLFLWLSLLSYQSQDPSWNTTTGPGRPLNLTGYPGSYVADLLLEIFGLAAFLFPVLASILAWKWLRSEAFEAPAAKLMGSVAFLLSLGTAFAFAPDWRLFGGTIPLGGALGVLTADYLISSLNTAGAILLDATVLILSLYLVSTFTVEKFVNFVSPLGRWAAQLAAAWAARRERARENKKRKLAMRLEKAREAQARRMRPYLPSRVSPMRPKLPSSRKSCLTPPSRLIRPSPRMKKFPYARSKTRLPGRRARSPCRRLPPPRRTNGAHPIFRLPATSLLNEAQARSEFDEQELKNIAVRVEIEVRGSSTYWAQSCRSTLGRSSLRSNLKPDAGIKYSRMTTLTEDLCLGLQAESILIERIPGKPTAAASKFPTPSATLSRLAADSGIR